METRAPYVVVGTFVLAIIFLGFVALLLLGRAQLSQESRTYYIFFRGSVSGLGKGSAVQYNGIPVGRVTDIRVDPDNVEQIQATVEIDGSLVDIKSDARAFLDTNILSGVSVVQIRGGTEGASNLEPQPGHRYPVIKTEQTEFEQVKATLPEVIGDIKSIAHQLTELLNDQNRAAFSRTLANVEAITAEVRVRAQELHVMLDDADRTMSAATVLLQDADRGLLGSGGLKDQASDTLADYRKLALGLEGTDRQLDATIQDLRPGLRDFAQRTLPQVPELIGEAQQLVTGLTRLTDEVERDPTRFLFGDRNNGYRPR
jgi:phospholipid/cholesterol/gamma-HCH transport system substrate-binding protein